MIGTTTVLATQLLTLFGPDDTAPTPHPAVWAGHQVTFGSRKLPFRGRVQTRTDTYVLARIDRRGDDLVVTQRACHVRFEPVGGVQVHMDARALPSDRFVLEARAGGILRGRSRVDWGSEDVDEDGNPGMTVVVDSDVCSGELYVSNDSRTRALAWRRSDGSLAGHANVRILQQVLGSQGVCLGLVAKDTKEEVRGPFAYVPVSEGASCKSWSPRTWPVDAVADL